MRLSSLSPGILPTTLVDALQALGIVSDADLLFSATAQEIWRKLPPGLMSLSEFECCIRAVMLRCAVPRSTVVGVSDSMSGEPGISVGIDILDGLLGETLRDSVVEVSGRHGSATAVRSSLSEMPLSLTRILLPPPWIWCKYHKTLALQIACNHLSLNPKRTALWIDTTGEFSPARADALLRSTESHEVCFPFSGRSA